MSAILAAILDFSKILFSAKMQQISRKYVFTASNTNIIKNEWKKIKTNFAKKLQFLFSNFYLHN